MKAIVLDIEGTTTDISFVHKVLFPYSKENFPKFLEENKDKEHIANIIQSIKNEFLSEDANLANVIEQINHWIETDQKISQLKELQGYIWVEGYETNKYQGHIYPEVKTCLEKWSTQGISLYIYSSGSVKAQKLLFSHTTEGDLTHLFSDYFDTKIGHKKETQSYRNIQAQIGINSEEILFLSDIEAELDAAKEAGFCTYHLNRDKLYTESKHSLIDSFNEVEL